MTDVVTQVTHLPGRAHLRSAQNGNYNIPRALTGFGRRPFSVAAWAGHLEQSSSGDQMHRGAFHLQASSEG